MIKEGVFCFIVCFGSVPKEEPKPVDSFCTRYTRIVLDSGDVGEIMKLPRRLRDRIQGNDLDYLCQCKNWNNPACRGQGSTGQ